MISSSRHALSTSSLCGSEAHPDLNGEGEGGVKIGTVLGFCIGWMTSQSRPRRGRRARGLWKRKGNSLLYIPFWITTPLPLFSPFLLLLLYSVLHSCYSVNAFCYCCLCFYWMWVSSSRKSIFRRLKKKRLTCHHHCKTCLHPELTDF